MDTYRRKTPLHRILRGGVVLVAVFAIAVLGYRLLGDYEWVDAIWMVVITISTVGYSEQSELGTTLQLFTIFVVLSGMTAAVYTFGGLMQLMLEGEIDRLLGTRRLNQQLRKLRDHVIICGYGRMGRHLANELRSQNRSLVVIDGNPDLADENVAGDAIHVIGDATDEEVLNGAGITHAKTLVISLPSDADNVFITLTARGMNSELQIIARAEQRTSEKKLRQAGANRVVMPAVIGARQMARMVTRPSTADLFELAAESAFVDLEIDEIEVKPDSGFAGKSVVDTQAHKRHKLLIIAIKRPDGELIFNPSAESRLNVADTLILMGHASDIESFYREFATTSS
ncbi:MAG: potassium channel protein [Pirellulaceae bacterium]|nr:potassium channel protein [Pirellulaceae bacterium]